MLVVLVLFVFGSWVALGSFPVSLLGTAIFAFFPPQVLTDFNWKNRYLNDLIYPIISHDSHSGALD